MTLLAPTTPWLSCTKSCTILWGAASSRTKPLGKRPQVKSAAMVRICIEEWQWGLDHTCDNPFHWPFILHKFEGGKCGWWYWACIITRFGGERACDATTNENYLTYLLIWTQLRSNALSGNGKSSELGWQCGNQWWTSRNFECRAPFWLKTVKCEDYDDQKNARNTGMKENKKTRHPREIRGDGGLQCKSLGGTFACNDWEPPTGKPC